MRVLFLPAYFKPEKAASDYLWDNLYEAFSVNDIVLETYAPSPCRGVSEDIKKEYRCKDEVLYDGHLVVKRFNLYEEGKNPIIRALRYVVCWFKHLRRGLSAKNCDCVFLASTPPIQGMIGAFIKKYRKIPFIFNLQDIFPDSLVNNGLAKRGGLLWKIGRVIENFTYNHADKIIVISVDFKKNILA